MRRRRFLKVMTHAALLAAVPVRWAAARLAPKEAVLAIRARRYPGKLKKWNQTGRPGQGRWAG